MESKSNHTTIKNVKTSTGGLNGSFGFMGTSFVNGKKTGGAAIRRSDGKMHTESLEELEKMGIYPL